MKAFLNKTFITLLALALFTLTYALMPTIGAPPTSASSSSEASSPDTFYFHGLKIGMTENDVKQIFPQILFSDKGPLRVSGLVISFSDPDVPASILFEENDNVDLELALLDDRLIQISIRWLPTSFDAMLPRLEKQFGTPVPRQVITEKYKTHGRKDDKQDFPSPTAIWIGEKVCIKYFQHYEHIKQSLLLFKENTVHTSICFL